MTRPINGIEYPDNLRGANLRGANLRGADLRGADLRDAYTHSIKSCGPAYQDRATRGCKGMRVTAELLRAKHACEWQVDLFAALFPLGAEITHELCAEHARSFDWGWAAKNLLPEKQWADYVEVRGLLMKDYVAARVPLWADYGAKHAMLWADYGAKHTLLRADYDAKHAPLWEDYVDKRALLLADYDAKHAPLLAGYIAKCASLFVSLADQVP